MAQDKAPSDADIRQLIVAASIASYAGECPCPESVTKDGHRCGGNSAYHRLVEVHVELLVVQQGRMALAQILARGDEKARRAA